MGVGISSELWWYMRPGKDDKKRVLTTVENEGVAPAVQEERPAVVALHDTAERFAVLRRFHSLEDVFEYFASVTKPDPDGGPDRIYMTPVDLLRALTMDLQSPLADSAQPKLSVKAQKYFDDLLSVADSDYDGLVSFHEFTFLTHLLHTPLAKFEVVFKVLDVDRSATLDIQELHDAVANGPSANGQKEKARLTDLLILQRPRDRRYAGLLATWFGKHGEKKLDYAAFASFMQNLQELMLWLQFESQDKGSTGTITGLDFAWITATSAPLRPFIELFERRLALLPRRLAEGTITLPDVRAFTQFTNQLREFEVALQLLSSRHAKIGKTEFARAVRAVADNSLSDVQLDILFFLFGADELQRLNYSQFMKLLHARRGEVHAHHTVDSQKHLDILRELFHGSVYDADDDEEQDDDDEELARLAATAHRSAL
ncbi:hypothetical protein RI367_008370 [Sorochytrium milnesiophthora]